jgi:hypothetical protein
MDLYFHHLMFFWHVVDTKTNLFQSASGKSVCVSEKAFQYARQTAMDENFQNKARRSLTLPENKIQNLEMSPRQQKSLNIHLKKTPLNSMHG